MTKKILAVAIIILILVTGMISGYWVISKTEKIVLKVFTAGSLSIPFADMEKKFESMYSEVDVQVQSGGSADMIRRVTDLHQTCDVLAVADYSLVNSMMLDSNPKYANYSLQFAKNSMVLAYTDYSKYRNEINSSNWYQILRRSDVSFGFSNPNDDPCGYRANFVIKLAETYYNDPYIYQDLVLSNTNIIGVDYNATTGLSTIKAPTDFHSTNPAKVFIRSAEVDLTSLLELGEMDYLFIYQSVAEQHRASGEKYLQLPIEINLNSTTFASNYSKVIVRQFADDPNPKNWKNITGKPIVYGVTIPFSCLRYDLAIEFVKLVINSDGHAIMRNNWQEPIIPAIASDVNAVPMPLRPYVN